MGRSKITTKIIHVATPDFAAGLELGYAKAVEAIIRSSESDHPLQPSRPASGETTVNVLVGSHLTPADVTELRDIVEAFGLRPIVLPDLSALDGSRTGISALAVGGTTMAEIHSLRTAAFTVAVGMSMEPAARLLTERFGIEHRVFGSIAGVEAVDELFETLSRISGLPIPSRYLRQRAVLIDGMRDAHFFLSGKRVCLALEPDHAVQVSQVLDEAGAVVTLAVIPTLSEAADRIRAQEVVIGDLHTASSKNRPNACDLLVSNSHARGTAKALNVPLYETGFPLHTVLGNTHRVSIGYRGTLALVNELGNLMMQEH